MDLLTLIKERRSVRQFLKEPIPHEDLEEILEVAHGYLVVGINKDGNLSLLRTPIYWRC